MPTYEYKRKDGSTFEIVQPMSDDALTKCPTTGQDVKRIISGGGGVVLKGSGWYVTDYKNKGNGKETDNEKKNGSSEAPKSETPKKSGEDTKKSTPKE
ncbi:MAG: zinc ribbon domain-containing protein [Balneolaceae bacterium]